MTEVKLPDLGDGIESGDVLEIFVSEGETIAEGQDIIEMETDKATVPVPSSMAGKVTKICVSEGDTVPIGGVLLEVEAESGAADETPESVTPDAPPAPVPPPENVQEPAPTPDPPSQPESAPQVAATPPAGTTSPEPTPPVAPTPSPAPASPAAASSPPAAAAPSATSGAIAAGPAIRRFAREVGVDLETVSGSGGGGRITREDVLAVVRAGQSGRSTSPATATAVSSVAAPPAAPATSASPASATDDSRKKGTAAEDDYGPIRVLRMDKVRKTIAKQMDLSWSTVPRVTNFDDADITDLERLRQSSKDDYASQGLKLTTMPFLIKAVSTALKHHPAINAVFDSANEQIVYKEYVNIGIAVDTDNGLMVPVMRGVDRMGVPDIARSLGELAGKVRGGSFGVNDLRGGTFTISNLGAIGGQYSTPIVNVPEVAILLVGRSRKLPVVMPDDSIQPRLMMPLSLSYDHRLVDGAVAGRFLNDIISYLEAPSRLLLAL